MLVEIICPYCQEHGSLEMKKDQFVTRVTCDEGCGKFFYAEVTPTQWTIDYYTNLTKGI